MLSAVVASAFAGLLDSAKTTATTTGIVDICMLATDVKVCLASTMTTITNHKNNPHLETVDHENRRCVDTA